MNKRNMDRDHLLHFFYKPHQIFLVVELFFIESHVQIKLTDARVTRDEKLPKSGITCSREKREKTQVK